MVGLIVSRDLADRGEQFSDRSLRRRHLFFVLWLRLAQQEREELGPSWREMKDRLEHQVLNHCLPANVDDERYAGTDLGDVRKILFRSDADVRAVSRCKLPQLANDMQVGGLV